MPTLELTVLHASTMRNLENDESQNTLTLMADLLIPEKADVVGMSNNLTLTCLEGGDGEDMLADWRRGGEMVVVGPLKYRPVYAPRQEVKENKVSLVTSINGLSYIPHEFRVVRGKAHVLLATRRVKRVLEPLQAGTRIELTPTLTIQLVEVNEVEGLLRFRFEYDAERPASFFDPDTGTPFIDSVHLIDDTGEVVVGHAGTGEPPGVRHGIYEGDGQMTFRLAEGRTGASIRFGVVLEMEAREVEFVAENVAMPIAPPAVP